MLLPEAISSTPLAAGDRSAARGLHLQARLVLGGAWARQAPAAVVDGGHEPSCAPLSGTA